MTKRYKKTYDDDLNAVFIEDPEGRYTEEKLLSRESYHLEDGIIKRREPKIGKGIFSATPNGWAVALTLALLVTFFVEIVETEAAYFFGIPFLIVLIYFFRRLFKESRGS